MFGKYCQNKAEPISVKVSREKGNVDLLYEVEFVANGKDSKHIIVVENKFKSFPTLAQLKKYENQYKHSSNEVAFILLTLADSKHWGECAEKWQIMNYGELAEVIRRHLPAMIEEKPNNKTIIEYYISLIENMDELFHEFDISVEEKFIVKDKSADLEVLDEMRFRSFIEKKRAERITYMIWEKLKLNKKLDKNHLDLRDFSTAIKFDEFTSGKSQIFASSGLTRSEGIIDLKYRFHRKLALGVQIQGQQYRRLIEGPEGADEFIKEFRDKLKDSSSLNWFDLSEKVGKETDRLYPKKGKEFNKYGASFFYKSYYIADESVKNIIDSVVEDFVWLHDHREELFAAAALPRAAFELKK